jgi:hypothetical protein
MISYLVLLFIVYFVLCYVVAVVYIRVESKISHGC